LMDIKMAEELTVHESMSNHVYYKIRTESKGFWGFYQKVESKISSLDLYIKDYRVNHSYDGSRKVMTEFYVRDEDEIMDTQSPRQNLIEKRRRAIAAHVGEVLRDPDCNVSVTRFQPRIRQGPMSRRRSSVYQLGQSPTEKPLRLSVKYFNTRRRQCCFPEDKISVAANQMCQEDCAAILVIDPKTVHKSRPKVLGMITRSDILRDIPKHGIEESHVCKQIMTPVKQLLVCDKGAARQEILAEMANGDCQNMVLIDPARCEVDAVTNIKDLCAFIVEPALHHDMKSMTNVLAGHYDDVYDSEEEEFNYRLGVRGVRPNSNLPLDGPFHDGQPVTWDDLTKLTTTGSFRIENTSAIKEALGMDDVKERDSDDNGGATEFDEFDEPENKV